MVPMASYTIPECIPAQIHANGAAWVAFHRCENAVKTHLRTHPPVRPGGSSPPRGLSAAVNTVNTFIHTSAATPEGIARVGLHMQPRSPTRHPMHELLGLCSGCLYSAPMQRSRHQTPTLAACRAWSVPSLHVRAHARWATSLSRSQRSVGTAPRGLRTRDHAAG